MSRFRGLVYRGRTVGHDSDNDVQNCGWCRSESLVAGFARGYICVDDHRVVIEQVVITPMHSPPIGRLGRLVRCCFSPGPRLAPRRPESRQLIGCALVFLAAITAAEPARAQKAAATTAPAAA